MAICCISSSRRSPTSAPTDMAAASKTACAFRSKYSRRCARRFRTTKPVGLRVSATDWIEGGWDLPQTIAFVHELKKRGLDWIDVSSGGVSPLQKIPLGPGYQVPLAQAVKEATGVTTIAVGLITEAKQAEDIVASGKADMVGAGARHAVTTRAGAGTPPPNSAAKSRRRRNTGARSPRRKRRCSARPRSGRGRLLLLHGLRRALSYPPLEGEGRLTLSAAKCETGWGDSLSTRTPPEAKDRHPTPPRVARASTLPLQGRVSGTPSHSRDAMRPRFVVQFRPRKEKRAQGKPGARCTRGLVCKIAQRKRTRAYRFSGGIPTFPAQWFYGLYVLSPAIRICLSPSSALAGANLTPTMRRQDHTILPSARAALVSRNSTVHRIPPRVRDDREPPLSSGETGKSIKLICPTG